MIAESLLAMMLNFNNKMNSHRQSQSQKKWERNLCTGRKLLQNQKALIIGYGKIGRKCADLLRAIGMEVAAVRRNPQKNDPDDNISTYTLDKVQELIPQYEHLILFMPSEAHGILQAESFKNCTHSYLYNFGRGGCISNNEILEALQAGYLQGAGLDVFENEPLPTDSPLWDNSQVIITPHSSCCYQEYRELFIQEVLPLIQT